MRRRRRDDARDDGGCHGEVSAQRQGEAARRRPSQSARPDDEHGVAGDRHAGAVAARRGAARAECAPDRRLRRRRRRPRSAGPLPPTPRSTSPASVPRSTGRASTSAASRASRSASRPASAVALNRVTGPDPSQIAGRIDANGQIILVNQSGVNFYKGAQVNAAGVMVERRQHQQQELHGRRHEVRPAGQSERARSTTRAPSRSSRRASPRWWRRRWPIPAPSPRQLGHVVLAGAKTATLDLYGDGLLSLDVTNQVTQAPVGDGNGDRAGDQHRRDHRRRRHGAAYRARGRWDRAEPGAGGRHDPRRDDGRSDRHVALNGVGGSIVVEGQLSAPGRAPGTTGGAIEVVRTAM